jgi:hypothetical protein
MMSSFASTPSFGSGVRPAREARAALGRLGAWLAQAATGPGAREADQAAYQLGLVHGALHRARLARGGVVQCVAGSLWITHDGEGVDHVVDAGQSRRIPARASFVAYALEAATVRVRPASAGEAGIGSE